MTPMVFALVLASVSLNALAQVILRKAMVFMAPPPPLSEPVHLALALLSNPFLWAGMASYAVSIGLWLAVLSKLQVGVAYPLLSIGYILAAVMGVAFLGESISLGRAGGILLICAGVFVVSRTA